MWLCVASVHHCVKHATGVARAQKLHCSDDCNNSCKCRYGLTVLVCLDFAWTRPDALHAALKQRAARVFGNYLRKLVINSVPTIASKCAYNEDRCGARLSRSSKAQVVHA